MVHKPTCKGRYSITPVGLVWYTNLPVKVYIVSHLLVLYGTQPTCKGRYIVTPVGLVWYTNLPIKVDILSHLLVLCGTQTYL